MPKSKDGTHAYSNLITTCEPCHSAIHNAGVMAPTADRQLPTPSVDILETAKEAKKAYRLAERIMRLFG